MSTRYFSLVFGIVYLLVGIVGFIPGFNHMHHLSGTRDVAVTTSYGYLLGLFPVNVLHNLVHIAVGIWGIASYFRFDAARIFCRSVAVIFALLTICGLIPRLDTFFGLVPLWGNDIWLHALTAIVSAIFGWMPVSRTTTPGDFGRPHHA